MFGIRNEIKSPHCLETLAPPTRSSPTSVQARAALVETEFTINKAEQRSMESSGLDFIFVISKSLLIMIMQNLRKSRGIVRLEAARCPDNDNQNDDNQNNDNQTDDNQNVDDRNDDNQKGDNHLSVSLPPQYGCCIGSICCFFVFYIFSFLRS